MNTIINMDDGDWAELTVSLTDVIDAWSETICGEHDIGYWYDGITYDMAVVAIGVLKASSKGQQMYEEETP